MKEFASDKIRNVCLAGSRGSGKTSLADTLAFILGANNRVGRVDEGSSLFDYGDGEISRKTSLSLKLLAAVHQETKINLLDCPGHVEFMGELLSAMKVCETVGIVIDAASGIEIGTRIQWRAMSDNGMARFFFVNKMDREHVKWRTALDSIQNAIGKHAVAVQIPIGEAETFKGVVDLLHMKAYTFDAQGKRQDIDIPGDLKADAEAQREALIEVAAETDDALMEKYFADGTLSDAEVLTGLRNGMLKGQLFPVLFGSMAKNIGARLILDFIVEYLPAPNQVAPESAIKTNSKEPLQIKCDPSGKTVAFVFKTISESHMGDMSFFRVYSGAVRPSLELVNQQTSSSERIGHIYTFQGKNRIDIDGAAAGDIGALVKLRDTHSGNTLAEKDFSVTIPVVAFPNPVMDVAVKPKAKGEEEKIGTGLNKLHEEDPTFRVVNDGALHQLVLYAQGSTHIEVLMEKLQKRFGVEADLAKPKIAYRETVRGKVEKQYKHKKQSGGRGQYGDVYIRIEPNQRGAGFEFLNEITGGVIPGKYIPAVEKGVIEQMHHGGLAGAPVVDVKVALYFGSYHDVDSSDMAFKIAGSMAFKEGFLECKPVLLEPIFNLEVLVPNEFTGDVMGDLSSRRGKVQGMDPDGPNQKIRAQVPQAELYQYSVDLRSMTQGQGLYTVEFSHYEDVPRETADKIIAEAKAMAAAEA
ncbi:MAG: elongation factor G [candidate division Zixibacteria bacterium]|nr:elongation factor G [candidate division Zixibacteria bacterium]